MKERKQAIKTVIAIITFTVLFIYLLNHTGVIVAGFARLISMMFPFLLGCAIAFIINIPMRGIENKFFKDETKGIYKYKRAISMIISYLFAIAVVGLVIFVVVPELAATVTKIKDKLPGLIEDAKAFVLKYTEKYPSITEKVKQIEVDWNEIGDIFKDKGSTIITTTVSVFSSILSTIVNIAVGIVFSAYILTQKETLSRQAKMIIYAWFKEENADELMVFGKIANTTFSKFFACQFREGLILGSMFLIVMSIIRMPYALTVGVVIAFTALIPVFGAFIGLGVGIVLLLVEAPKLVVWFIVLFFVLQFIENYFIYPKLVGGDIGLPAIWVLLAVIVGGDLMGVVGMFVFIPLVSVIYAYTRSIIYRKLKKKDIDVEEKQAPDDVAPLMEGRRRLFQPRGKKRTADNVQNEFINGEIDIDNNATSDKAESAKDKKSVNEKANAGKTKNK